MKNVLCISALWVIKLQPLWFSGPSRRPETVETRPEVTWTCAGLQSVQTSSHRYPSHPCRPLTVQNEEACGGRWDKSHTLPLLWSCCSIHHVPCGQKERPDVFLKSCSFWEAIESRKHELNKLRTLSVKTSSPLISETLLDKHLLEYK